MNKFNLPTKARLQLRQVDKGWVLSYRGHGDSDESVLCKEWNDVLVALEGYFDIRKKEEAKIKKI